MYVCALVRTSMYRYPTGLLSVPSLTNLAWKHVIEHIGIPRKCHIFFLKFVTFVTFKVPSGRYVCKCYTTTSTT